jgi:broad specificity phosphatase PhoE
MPMIDIWFEYHAETHHNAAGLASGHYDVALTNRGREHAQSVLRARYSAQHFDAAYTSDTQRAYDTARLMTAGRGIPILRDARLRECDYGVFEARPRTEMEAARLSAIHTPYPEGESYRQVAERMRSFLTDLANERDGQCIMIIGHGATLYTLNHWLRRMSLEEAIGDRTDRPWRFELMAEHWRGS